MARHHGSTAALLTLLFTACATEDAPLITPDVKPAPETVVTAMPEPAAPPTYAGYDPVAHKDPFKPFYEDIDEPTLPADTSPLRRFELEQLRLIAVVTGTATPTAMVQDPSGVGHLVRVGMLVGRSGAQVKHIRRGEIILQHETRGRDMRRITQLVPMRLVEESQPM